METRETPVGNVHQDDEDRTYSRIACGVVWPGDLPGFAVVVGEEAPLGGREHRRYYVLAEREDADVAGLLRRVRDELVDQFEVDMVVASLRNSDHTAFLVFWNEQRRANMEDYLILTSAPNSDTGSLVHHVGVLRSYMAQAAPRLLFADSATSIPAALQSVPQAVTADVKDEQHPQVAALGYALSYLVSTAAPLSLLGRSSYDLEADAWGGADDLDI